LVAIWETTQARDVPCLDYGDSIQPEVDPLELSTLEAQQLIDEMAELCCARIACSKQHDADSLVGPAQV
jgi:hypothetical protein